jgi:hypothetical protein
MVGSLTAKIRIGVFSRHSTQSLIVSRLRREAPRLRELGVYKAVDGLREL